MNSTEEHQTFWSSVRVSFGRGLVVLVPVVITLMVLNIMFNTIDGIISPIFDHLLDRHIPGLGFITMILLILFVGLLSRNLIGRALFKFFERILFTIPLARNIYSAMKDLFSAFGLGGKGKSFRQVVLVEYPRPGVWTIGFVTNEVTIKSNSSQQNLTSVYIPNPPNPTSGMLVLVPQEHLNVLDMSVEDGLKLVLSGGIVTSGTITTK
jgi:uncharacterized membrane protein